MVAADSRGLASEAAVASTVAGVGEGGVFTRLSGSLGSVVFVERASVGYSKGFGGGGAWGSGAVALSDRATRLERAAAGFWYSRTVNSMA